MAVIKSGGVAGALDDINAQQGTIRGQMGVAATLLATLFKETDAATVARNKHIFIDSVNGVDTLTNTGASPFCPFATFERAFKEAARLSIVAGSNNDKFDEISIHVAPGDYVVDNTPGGNGGLNPATGGLITPRGVSVVGSDLRKVRIRPTLSTAGNNNVRYIFKVTGNTFLEALTFTDANGSATNHNNIWAVGFATLSELTAYYNGIAALFSLSGQEVINFENEIVNAYNATGDVVGASPYVYNCSVRSKYGMNGLLCDGSAATGLKSMVTAQFTQISLQTISGGIDNPSKPQFSGTRKGSIGFLAKNDGYVQIVSCFCVGNDIHFGAESGGELSITNSCSDFGNTGVFATGYKAAALAQDKGGSWTHIICPLAINTDLNDNANPYRRDINLFQFKATDNSDVYINTTTKVYVTATLNQSVMDGLLPYVVKNDDTIYVRDVLGAIRTAKTAVSGAVYGSDANGSYFIVQATGNTITNDGANDAEREANARLCAAGQLFLRRIVDTRAQIDRTYRIRVTKATGRPPLATYVLGKQATTGLFGNKPYTVNVVEDKGSNVYWLTLTRANNDSNGTPDSFKDIYPNPINYNAITGGELTALNDPNSITKTAINEILTAESLSSVLSNLSPKAEGSRELSVGTAIAVEFRRPSIIRASGHTWEWVGYGLTYNPALPGNQSTTLTEAQYLAALRLQRNGGYIFSSGMDENGLFYIGDKQIDLSTGAEKAINAPNVFGSSPQNVFERLTVISRLLSNGRTELAGRTVFPSTAELQVDFNQKVLGRIEDNLQYYGFATRATPTQVLNEESINAFVTPSDLKAWRFSRGLVSQSTRTNAIYISKNDGWANAQPGDASFGASITYTQFTTHNTTNNADNQLQVTDPNKPLFRAFTTLADAAAWANVNLSSSEVAVLHIKAGRYSLNGATFNCGVDIDGTRGNGSFGWLTEYGSLEAEPTSTVIFYQELTTVGSGANMFLAPRGKLVARATSTVRNVIFWGVAQTVASNLAWSYVSGSTTINKTTAIRTLVALIGAAKTALSDVATTLQGVIRAASFIEFIDATATLRDCVLGPGGHPGNTSNPVLNLTEGGVSNPGYINLSNSRLTLRGLLLKGNETYNIGPTYTTSGGAVFYGFHKSLISIDKGESRIFFGNTGNNSGDKNSTDANNIRLANAAGSVASLSALRGTAGNLATEVATRGPIMGAFFYILDSSSTLFIENGGLFSAGGATDDGQGFAGAFGFIDNATTRMLGSHFHVLTGKTISVGDNQPNGRNVTFSGAFSGTINVVSPWKRAGVAWPGSPNAEAAHIDVINVGSRCYRAGILTGVYTVNGRSTQDLNGMTVTRPGSAVNGIEL